MSRLPVLVVSSATVLRVLSNRSVPRTRVCARSSWKREPTPLQDRKVSVFRVENSAYPRNMCMLRYSEERHCINQCDNEQSSTIDSWSDFEIIDRTLKTLNRLIAVWRKTSSENETVPNRYFVSAWSVDDFSSATEEPLRVLTFSTSKERKRYVCRERNESRLICRSKKSLRCKLIWKLIANMCSVSHTIIHASLTSHEHTCTHTTLWANLRSTTFGRFKRVSRERESFLVLFITHNKKKYNNMDNKHNSIKTKDKSS